MSLTVISKMTAFQADLSQNACYGHAHNSCRGRCAVNQITIGNGPDFVMRVGGTTYSHHVSIIFTPVADAAKSESLSNPSLHSILRLLKQKLTPLGWNQTLQVHWVHKEKLTGTCKTTNGTILIQYHFVQGLTLNQKNKLHDEFITEFNPKFF